MTSLWLLQSLFNSRSFVVIFYFQEWDEGECLDTEVLSGSMVRLRFDEGVWNAVRIIIHMEKKVPFNTLCSPPPIPRELR
jgi:hypothetical protein